MFRLIINFQFLLYDLTKLCFCLILEIFGDPTSTSLRPPRGSRPTVWERLLNYLICLTNPISNVSLKQAPHCAAVYLVNMYLHPFTPPNYKSSIISLTAHYWGCYSVLLVLACSSIV